MRPIQNIYCVGRNYRLHAEELGNAVPTSPMIFSKPTHAVIVANGQTISLPRNSGEIHYEAELVLHIGKSYQQGISAEELIDQISLGIDFTLRDVQSKLKSKGHPWLLAKGFPNAAVLTDSREYPGIEALQETNFALQKNGERVQQGNIQEMIFDFQTIVDFIGTNFGLGEGDVIYTGTPAGVGKVENGDHLQLVWGDEEWGSFTVEM
ncbi:fumarylacetoacetate hydrolase family protein [Risungbinella massiliensis]|uniref:fumarylacetoacetate hydrolase family protein n=1 Tax=Risungbinella massiliensis TaxID=1329796 RepID=UPI0005CC7672|nr:fumarylacetoacetate hydrolase family protein [Risungbinella massiliensis]